MRRYIVGAVVIVGVGVAASLFILPSSKEIETQKSVAAEQRADAAPAIDLTKVDVEAEYNQGHRSFQVIAALADKRVAAGDRPAAIKLLEEYVAANQTDTQGRKKLAEQYQLAGRQGDYNTQLEAIAAAEPTEKNLRVLSDVYNANKDYVKQAQILKKIVEVTQGVNPQSYVDLATIELAAGDKPAALQALDDLKKKHPEFASYAVTRIRVTILAEQGQTDQAFQTAQDWINTPVSTIAPAPGSAPATPSPANADPRPGELADLCNILHYSGHADKAVALVDPHLDMLERSPELVEAYVKADITAGRSDQAFAILQKIDEAQRMSPALYPIYLDLTLKREDTAGAQTIANKVPVVMFNEEQALTLIETARADNAPAVVKTLTTRFGTPKLLEGKPVLAAVIAILDNSKQQDQAINAALSHQLSSIQRIDLAQACARAQKTACFNAILKQFPPMDTMSPAQIAEYAQLYIIADRPGEIIDHVGIKAKQPNAHADIVMAYYKLAAAAGRMDILKPWLQSNGNTLSILSLQQLFYTANDHHQHAVASDIAERLYARDPSPVNRDIMTNALVAAGEYEKAMPLLRDQLRTPGTNDSLYVSTLSKLARKNPDARKELNAYAETALKSNHGDNRQQLNYAYVLINNGHKDIALPVARKYATERGGEWKKMVAQLTQPAGKAVANNGLSREQLVAMSGNKTMSIANRRQFAFALLDQGDKTDAAVVFQDLAKDKGPDSQEVKDLLYIWGGKLDSAQLQWVTARAATANPYDKLRWMEIVNNASDDQTLVQYVSATPEALYSRPLRQRYFSVLAESGRSRYDTAMRGWVAQTTDIPALNDYASGAQAHGYRDAARSAYRRVLELDPNNSKALSQLAALQYSVGKYSEADRNITQYLAATPQATEPGDAADVAQAHFYKGELLHRQGNNDAAQIEYQQTVTIIRNSGIQAPDALSRLYLSYFRLGQHDVAKAGYEQLLAAHPDDKGILADYMNALIEYHYLNDASRIANQYDKSSPYYHSAPVAGNSGHVSAVERFSQGRELKIAFSDPIEGKSPLALDASTSQWLDHSSADYDSVTLSARPGYIIRYIPTAQEQFQVVASAAPEYTPQVESERQQTLRLQLLYARIEVESGQPEKAKQRLDILQQYYPGDPQVLAAQAGIASARGDTSQARDLLRQAQAQAPENEDLAGALRTERQANSEQFVKLDQEYRNYGNNYEYITTLSGVVRVGGNNEVGANIANDFVNYKGYPIPTQLGMATQDGHTYLNRQSAELFAAHYLDSGSRVQASVFVSGDVFAGKDADGPFGISSKVNYGDESTLGGGLYYAFNAPIGRTELLGEYHKPYWDYAEAVISYATRDRVGVTDYIDLTPRLSLGIETSVNNYNIEPDYFSTGPFAFPEIDGDSVAQSFLLRASFTYALQQQTKTQPYFGIGYGFDGEYLFSKPDTEKDPFFGVPFRPFDFQHREIHQITGIYRDDWTPTTHVLLDAGWVANRYGWDNGPVAEGRLTQDINKKWELGLRGRYARVNSNTDGDAVNAGAYLKYKF